MSDTSFEYFILSVLRKTLLQRVTSNATKASIKEDKKKKAREYMYIYFVYTVNK